MVATGVVDSFARLPALLLGNLVGLVMLVREGWSTGGRMRGIRRWRGAMVPIVFLYMIIAWLAWILYPLCAFLLRVLHRRRPLSTFERAALDGVPAEILNSITVVEEPHWCMSLFFKGTHACAIDREVYLHAEDAKRLSAAVCRHEVLHLFQYGRAGGFSAFLGQYFAFTLYDLMATRSAAEAYKRNPFECEALSYEDLKTWRANASKQWIYY